MTAMRDAFTVTLHQHRQGEDTFLRPNIRLKADPCAVIDCKGCQRSRTVDIWPSSSLFSVIRPPGGRAAKAGKPKR